MFHRDFLKESHCCCWLGKFRHIQLLGPGKADRRGCSHLLPVEVTGPHPIAFAFRSLCLISLRQATFGFKDLFFSPKLTFSLLEVLPSCQRQWGDLEHLCSGNLNTSQKLQIGCPHPIHRLCSLYSLLFCSLLQGIFSPEVESLCLFPFLNSCIFLLLWVAALLFFWNGLINDGLKLCSYSSTDRGICR